MEHLPLNMLVEKINKRIYILKNLNSIINEIIRELLPFEREFISDLNRKQLKQGIKSTGDSMPNYVDGSGKIKLFDTGLFHEGIQPLFEDDQIVLEGTDEKTGILMAKYDPSILGLTDQNIGILAKRLLPKIIARLRKLLT